MPITRQSYFLPTQITGCSLWLDAADPATIGFSSGSNVNRWADKSGNGLHASNTSLYPTYTGSNLVFNGSKQLLLPPFIPTATQNITIATVWTCTSASTGGAFQSIIEQTGTAAGTWWRYMIQGYTFGGRNAYMYGINEYGDNPVPISNFPTFVIGTPNLSFISQTSANGVNFTISNFASGSLYGTQTYGTGVSAGSQASIGSNTNSEPFTGTINEIIIYNAALGTTDRQNVEGYLAQKWGLTASLISGHPGLNKIIYRNLQTTFTKKQYYTAFSPKQIGGCSLWLDGADPAGTGTPPANGASIATWVDKSGLGQTITQATTANQALYTSGGGLTFTSGMQYPLNTSVFMTMFSVEYTIFVVEKRAVSGLGFFIGNTAGGGGPLYLGYNGTTVMRFTTASIVDLDYTVPAYSGSDATEPIRIWACRWFGSSVNSRDIGLNGQLSPLTQAFNQAPSFSGNQSIGGCLYGNYVGKMYEMIIFNVAISDSAKQKVESYLAQKWGLVSSLPAGHLNATFPAGSPTAIQPYVTSIRTALTYAAIPTYALKYTYTGSNQSFVVPSGVTSVNVYIWGAGGGAGLGAGGGAGCYVQGILTVIPGETLTIVVGQGGGNKASSFGKTYGGGGSGGGLDTGRSDIVSSQGGGRSAIVRSATDLVTAAAGGGGRGGRGGRGRLVTGENGTGVATGGTQSAGGTNNGAIYSGGNANQDNSAGGGSGYYGGGGGNQDQAGGGGSCLTSNLSLLAGESTYGTESSNGVLAPQTSSPYYNSDVAFGATSSYGYNYGSGGNGLVVIGISSKIAIASVSYSRLILSAWFGSVAYRYGLDVTTVVNNAFGGNPSNTITLNVATLTNPQIGTTKFTYIVYMFNGIQKFSSPYAEGTVLTFSSLT